MRFNRVLLLAASINVAVLAMIFTISCSGDKGSSGTPGTNGQGCTIQGANLVCEDGTSIPIGDGTGSGPSCSINAQKQLVCDGEIVTGGDLSNCEISTVGEGATALMVDCGAGGRFGMCAQDVFDFETHFCDYGVVAQNPECATSGKSANPNFGEACEGGVFKDCGATEHYWSVSADASTKEPGGTYSCELSTLYRLCGTGDNAEVFEVGETRVVYDYILNGADTKDSSLLIFSKGTHICKSNAIAACPAGWIARPNYSNILSAPTDCQPAVHHGVCRGAGSDTLDVYDARTTACENAGTAQVKLTPCEITVPVHGGETGYNPYEPSRSPAYSAPSISSGYVSGPDAAKAAYSFGECGLNAGYRECMNRSNNVTAVFLKKDYICAGNGTQNPNVEKCENGMVPNALEDETDPLGWTACIDGARQCRVDRNGYFNPEDNLCYFSAKHACLANNKDTTSNCKYASSGWTDCGTQVSQNVGKWTVKENDDRYWLGSDSSGTCYRSAREACVLGKGDFWTEVGLADSLKGNPNATNIDSAGSACKAMSEFVYAECKAEGFYWGDLTDSTSNSCARTPALAKVQCEEVSGYESTPVRHKYVWASNECKTIKSAYATSGECTLDGRTNSANGIFHWDGGIDECFWAISEARDQCALDSSTKEFLSGNCVDKAACVPSPAKGTCTTETDDVEEDNCDGTGKTWTLTDPALGNCDNGTLLVNNVEEGDCNVAGGETWTEIDPATGTCTEVETGVIETACISPSSWLKVTEAVTCP